MWTENKFCLVLLFIFIHIHINHTVTDWPLCIGQSSLFYTVSQKNCAELFLSELRQISTNFDNFWQKDGKEATIMRGALIFHLT